MEHKVYDKQRHKEVADLLRIGKGSPELEAEYAVLSTLKPRQVSAAKNLWDLPVFERCWKGDAREIER